MRGALLLGAAALCAGCGPADPSTPRLSALSFDGQAPDSTLVLLMSVHFEDEDGDLGRGQLETFINQTATSAGPIPLLGIFVQNDVPLDAVEGELEFVLELSFPDEESDWPAEGSTFRLGTRAIDAEGNASSTVEVALRLSYD